MRLCKKPASSAVIARVEHRCEASREAAEPSGADSDRKARIRRPRFAGKASRRTRYQGSSGVHASGVPISVAQAQREKLEALGQMAGGLVHDLGNVLAAIRLNLTAIEQHALNPANRAIVDTAIAAADDGEKAIRSLLSFSRLGPPHFGTIDVMNVLSRTEALMRHALEAQVQVECHAAPNVWPIAGDEVQLELALLNLAINARDAMPHGGTLRIEAFNTRPAAIANRVAGDFVAITVTDTGIGMSHQVASNAFRPFFTTKGPDKGTGLGLSQVHRFAKDCGGVVILDTALRRGTTVTMVLPRATEYLVALSA